jgi:hypothetical protein
LDRALAFEKPLNGPMREQITVDILKIDENDFKKKKKKKKKKKIDEKPKT